MIEDCFEFVNARQGWDLWDLDVESPDVVCVVPRNLIGRVTLFRGEGAMALTQILGLEEGLLNLLINPEKGMVLLKIDLGDVDGEIHSPVFLLTTDEMQPGDDELAASFIVHMCEGTRPIAELIEKAFRKDN